MQLSFQRFYIYVKLNEVSGCICMGQIPTKCSYKQTTADAFVPFSGSSIASLCVKAMPSHRDLQLSHVGLPLLVVS
ncbi:hypothetical protein HanRHA438_Chr15g0711911 [Helianthus annuus]|nr:hypothetical protein HanRHA438_Chr15g0711911 [Helianthus annuus]